MKKIKYLCQGAALKFYLLHTHRHEISYSPPARPVQPHTRRQIPCICKETWRRKWQMSPVDAQHTDTLTPPHPSTSHLVNLRASLCNWHHQIFPSHLSLSSFHFSPPLPTLVPALHSSAIETFTEKKKKKKKRLPVKPPDSHENQQQNENITKLLFRVWLPPCQAAPEPVALLFINVERWFGAFFTARICRLYLHSSTFDLHQRSFCFWTWFRRGEKEYVQVHSTTAGQKTVRVI